MEEKHPRFKNIEAKSEAKPVVTKAAKKAAPVSKKKL